MRAIVLFLLALLVTSINAQSIKIGYIDVEEVINSLPQYQHDNDSLIQQFEPKKQQLLDLFKHIELLKKNLNNVDRSINNENYQKELDNIRELEASFQKETELWQQQLNQKKYESLQKIETMINLTIEEFAISENYDLILYQNAAFVSDQVNITNQIISKIEGTSP
ncbi:MAG: OmpH family outer membrane protein [Candidatus Marinimicrobia bacterium]|jgi:outer membrane protein|nr:OmpH family outer membrane protein [Candidatus Neomarinimicrobiota bacterium]